LPLDSGQHVEHENLQGFHNTTRVAGNDSASLVHRNSHRRQEAIEMIRVEKICVLIACIAMFGCGGMSSPKTATDTWRAVMTSTTAQPGQQGERAILLVFLQQNGNALNATVNAVLQQSSCFPTGAVAGTTLKGQVILPGGEAISNLQLTGSLLNMTGGMQSDANSGAGTFTLNPHISGCPIGTGTFQMTRMPML